MSNSINPLAPITTFEGLSAAIKDGVRYFDGSARKYRFNASSGIIIDHMTEEVLFSSNKKFMLSILGYRTFSAEMFGIGEKEWCELYFVNTSGSICFLQFHGYSVGNLRDGLNMLVHEGARSVTGVPFELSMEKRSATTEEGSKTYYVLRFNPIVKSFDQSLKDALDGMAETYRIYNSDTLLATNLSKPQFGLNYNGVAGNLLKGGKSAED